MKRVKVIITGAVIMLAIGGAFASKKAPFRAYTTLDDAPPGQTAECQLRGTCPGTGSLCYVVLSGVPYQLYYSGCSIPLNGIFAP